MSITTVAEKAGVSRMTVSRVIRGEATVRPETRDKVLKAIKQTGYTPSPAARALRSKDKLKASACLCCALVFGPEAQVARDFYSDISQVVEQELARHGLCVVHSHFMDSLENSLLKLQALFSLDGLCGVILAGRFSTQQVKFIRKKTANIVVVDGPAPIMKQVAAVEPDYVAGARLALAHFQEIGCRRILVITGLDKQHYFAQAMLLAAAEYAGCFETIDSKLCDLTLQSGYDVTRTAFADGRTYDGVFATDQMLLGVMRALNEMQLGVPDQVKLVGFDDIECGGFMTPALTTVRVDRKQLGQEAVSELLKLVRAEKNAAVPAKVVIRPTLVVRESTGMKQNKNI